MRDQPRVRLEQPAARVECRLEDLLLEWFVADDLGHQQVGGLGQLDLTRPPGDERDSVSHVVHGEHTLGDRRDIAGLDRVDVPGARPGGGDGEHAAPGADVENDVSRSHGLHERRHVLTRPAVVVQHAGVLHRVRPAARRPPVSFGLHEGAILDQHVDDAQRRHEVGRAALPVLEPLDRVPESQRA